MILEVIGKKIYSIKFGQLMHRSTDIWALGIKLLDWEIFYALKKSSHLARLIEII